jgi:hypothetical protein
MGFGESMERRVGARISAKRGRVSRRLTVTMGTLVLTRIIHEASAASADTRLQRALSPLSPSTYCTSMPQGFMAPSARLALRLHAFATNLHEKCGLKDPTPDGNALRQRIRRRSEGGCVRSGARDDE